MAGQRGQQLGMGPLTARRVIEDSLAMLRQSFVRIAAVALVFFALPATLAAAIEVFLESNPDHGPVALGIVLVTLAVAVFLRTLGPIAFAGFLDAGVANEYLRGTHRTLAEVLRTLPWRRLIVADILVTVVVTLGLAVLIVPGLVAYGLLGLIGPVVVQEDANLPSSFRRTIALSRSVPRLVIVLVVIPFAFEQILHESILEAVLHDAGFTVQILTEWVLAIVIGGTLGLLEVALAAELMERNPLLDDGQAPAV